MIHNYQKRWVFTWNSSEEDGLVSASFLQEKLNKISTEGVFQLEVGQKTGREHYQGRFVLKGPRRGKQSLLKEFSEIFNTKNLTLQPEIAYNSSSYCEKSETQIAGPWYVGLQSYLAEKQPMTLKLKKWQDQLLSLLTSHYQEKLRDRKVIWIQDRKGGQGKSTFIRYLAMNEKKLGLGVEKLPMDRPDRIRSAVVKLSKKKDVDMYMFDFTRTQGVDTHFQDLFEVIEEIKNAYVVDIMYGNFNRAFLKPAMVVIFTNNHIADFQKYLSNDRWMTFILGEDGGLTYLDIQDPKFPISIQFELFLDSIQ